MTDDHRLVPEVVVDLAVAPHPRPALTRVGAVVVAAALALAATAALTPLRSAPDIGAMASATSVLVAAPVAVDPAVERAISARGSAPVVVRAVPGSEHSAAAAFAAAGGTVERQLPIIAGFSGRATPAALDALRALRGVVIAVTSDAGVTLSHDPSLGVGDRIDSSFVERIGADRLHAQGFDGAGVGIAVIDTGISPISDLADRVAPLASDPLRRPGSYSFSASPASTDTYGHGTFVASVAAGSGASSNGEHAGVAPGAHLISLKITGPDGSSDVSQVLAALQYAVSFRSELDIDVINLSFGTDSPQSWTVDPLNYAVQQAWAAGIVVVVSAGNHGATGPGTVTKPADDPFVITVGAADSQGTPTNAADDAVAAYSSLGPTKNDGLAKPDLVAPGSHVVGATDTASTLYARFYDPTTLAPGYMRGSGTSFASAVVSGAAALLLDAHPDWTPNQVKNALRATARPLSGAVMAEGAGIIDVAAASALASPSSTGAAVKSTGRGSMTQARGNVAAKIKKADGTIEVLDDEAYGRTAQGKSFNRDEYLNVAWTGSQWYGSQWYGSQWYGSNWYGDGWSGTPTWSGSQWYGSQWYGSQWY